MFRSNSLKRGKEALGLTRVQIGVAPPRTSSFAAAAAAGPSTAAAAATTTVTTTTGHVLTMSEFISRFDESARRRLNSMNDKLRGLEMQMEALEAEMRMANNDPSIWS